MGSFNMAQDERKTRKAKDESPKARLARVKAEAKEEAFRGRQRPLDGAAFDGFLRSGRPG